MGRNNFYLSNKAKNDLENIFYYISEELRNPESALRLIDEIEQKFSHIVEFPYSYPVIEDSKINHSKLRKCIFHTCLIIYHFNEEKNQIEIVRIINYRMDIL
jgi:toxin ParE1/3/4